MRRHLRPGRIVTLASLTAIWCVLWGEATFANIAAGIVVAVAVTSFGLGPEGTNGVRLVPLLRLAWLVTVDLVKSTVSVAREILTPTDYTDESVVAVNVAADGRHHMLLLTVAITLTPGTAVVDVDPDTGTLYLHLLHDEQRAATIEHVKQLAHLACEALPTTPRTVST